MHVTMGKVLIVAMAFLGSVIMCSSHPGFKKELQVNNEETIENPTFKKERDKRTANHPPDKSEGYNPVDQPVHETEENFANDSGFLKNLEFVFSLGTERKHDIAPATYVYDESMNNLPQGNNTGLEDRLRSLKELKQLYKDAVSSQTSTATAKNGLHTDSKDQDDQMLLVFGHPSIKDEHATETPPQLITQANKLLPVFVPLQLPDNIEDADNSFTSARTSHKNHDDGEKNGSNTKITFFYMYFICSLFVLFCL